MEIQGECKRRRWYELVSAIATSKLPSDLVIQIVSRLPVKSVLRFKLVSKAWYALFTSPKFAQSYLQTASNMPCLMVQTNSKDGTSNLRVVESLDGWDPVVRDLEPPVAITTDSELVGCINGLVCLSLCMDASSFVLWNPATGKHFRIPNPGLSISRWSYKVCLGFAYEEETDCYKIIRIIRPMWSPGPEHPATVDIYSSGTNTWRQQEFKNFPSGCQPMSGSTFRGSYYWFGVASAAPVHKPFVMRFDPSTEKFTWKYVLLPLQPGELYQFREIGMGFEGESPVLFALKPPEVEELGPVVLTYRLKKESLGLEESNVVVGLFLKRLLGIWIDGETIGLDEDGELVMYDYEAEDAVYLPLPPSDGPMETANACEYTPSLLPPPYPSA